MDIKDKYVLHIGGHVENNTSYYEEHNSNYSINTDLILEESKYVREMGYEIKVNKLYDDYVELSIDNERIINLKPEETQYIVSEDNTYGMNENFVIDKKLLFVELKEIDFDKIRHILNYQDYTKRIDENIIKIKSAINLPEIYFEIENTLQIYLFRLTDEGYLERLKVSKNVKALKERERLLPYLSIIKELISDINCFDAENKKIIDAIIKKGSLDTRDFNVLSCYLYNLAFSNCAQERIPFDMLEEFLDVVMENTVIKENYEYTLLHYYLVKIASRHRYYFNHAYLAYRVSFNVKYDMVEEATKQELYEMAMTAGDFLLMLYKREDAMECYYNASRIALEDNDLLNSAYAMEKYYRINSQFPESKRKYVDIEKIKKDYKKFAKIVISGVNYKGLKIDEVEFTDLFINNFPKVMALVEEEISLVGDLYLPYQRWDLMQKYYLEKYDLVWRNPKQMNPKVMFD
mgnify:CR=1 FL=1